MKRISHNFWNDPKHTSAVYALCLFEAMLSDDNYKNRELINTENYWRCCVFQQKILAKI